MIGLADFATQRCMRLCGSSESASRDDRSDRMD